MPTSSSAEAGFHGYSCNKMGHHLRAWFIRTTFKTSIPSTAFLLLWWAAPAAIATSVSHSPSQNPVKLLLSDLPMLEQIILALVASGKWIKLKPEVQPSVEWLSFFLLSYVICQQLTFFFLVLFICNLLIHALNKHPEREKMVQKWTIRDRSFTSLLQIPFLNSLSLNGKWAQLHTSESFRPGPIQPCDLDTGGFCKIQTNFRGSSFASTP